MGYEVYITRKTDWHDDDGPEIKLDEWCSLVNESADMRLDGYAEATTSSGEVLRIDKEGLSVWTSYSKHEENGNMAWFYYLRGNISVKNPDEEILKKMYLLSESLDAKLQGEEGEIYDKDGQSNWKELRYKESTKKWWQFF